MIRPMILANSGWYPFSADECKREIARYVDHDIFLEGMNPVAAIVPHAGWYFCGHLSVNCIRLLKEKNGDIDHVIVFGGHLSENNLAVLETFTEAETPFGNLKSNETAISILKNDKNIQPAPYLQDNTVEILLPIIYYFFGPSVTVTAVYLPPNVRSIELAERIYKNFYKKAVFIGSTDLTHYGSNYGFTQHDKSMSAIDWVRNVNDKGYVDLLLDCKEKESLTYAHKKNSACSAGAAVGALTVARLSGVDKGHLIGYSTSYEKHEAPNFVGYTGIIY